MKLKDRISSLRPSDNSGSRISNRFDFQKDWAICKLLELHRKDDDYLLTFEHHDDILVFNSTTDPTRVSFYQIKTSEKTHWTLTSLLKSTKGKNGVKHSYLGKLYEHLEIFDNDTECLFFVTNCKLDGKLKDEKHCDGLLIVKCSDLCDDDRATIETKIKKEYNVDDLNNFIELLSFQLNELNVLDHVSLTKGRLSEFLEAKFPDLPYQITPLYKAIFDEIKMKTDFEPTVIDFESLKRYKSVTRSDFDRHLKTIEKAFLAVDAGNAIEGRLNSELVPISEVTTFRRNAVRYRINKMSYNDRTFNQISEVIGKSIQAHQTSFGDRLYDNMVIVFNDVKSYVTIELDAEYIKCMILFLIYERQF